ncbi:MAG: M3 family peptidase, partial [Bdellovibrionales bacterium]|nr:M3 family peptidase [Bdellovibrionales bacterium]
MKIDESNPLLKGQTAAGGVPVPFGDIKPDHFLPAIEFAVGQALQRLNEIVSNPQAPDFDNTILALETSSDWVSFASDVFFNLHNTDATEEIHKLAEPISLRLAQFTSEVTLNEALFQRVKTVFKNSDRSRLNSEQLQLLDKTYKSFVRNGSLLVAEGKEKLKEIDQELARLGPQFSQNVLKATQKFFLHLTDEADIGGLPESLREAMKEKAQERNLRGYVVTLDEPFYVPFLKFSDRGDLREKLWMAYGARAYHDEFDNSANVLQLANLRHQRAKLLGFKSHAHYVLEERMAQDPQTVTKFLDRLLSF